MHAWFKNGLTFRYQVFGYLHITNVTSDCMASHFFTTRLFLFRIQIYSITTGQCEKPERNGTEPIGACVDLKISLFLSDKIQCFVLSFYLCGYFSDVLLLFYSK